VQEAITEVQLARPGQLCQQASSYSGDRPFHPVSWMADRLL